MAALSDNAKAWTYTTGAADTFRLRAKSEMVAQLDGSSNVKVGGAAAATTVSLPVKGFRPRRVYVVDQATGAIRRSVVLYDADAPLATAGTTITLRYNGADTVFESTGGILGEKLPAGIAQQS
ncbi:MAG TPA: hypothetical protein V6C97_27125 [Oculatellaceae cyanobacterium]